jgi:pseudoazurin
VGGHAACLQPGYACYTLVSKKGKFMRYLLLVSAMLFATPSLAADLTIEMLNKDENGNKMVFSQEVARLDVGDTITWVPTMKGHNVEMMASPNDMKFKSKVSKEVSVTFDTPGIYYYLCTPHKGMGMIGLVVVGGDVSNKDEVAKAKALGKSKKKLKALLKTI